MLQGTLTDCSCLTIELCGRFVCYSDILWAKIVGSWDRVPKSKDGSKVRPPLSGLNQAPLHTWLNTAGQPENRTFSSVA